MRSDLSGVDFHVLERSLTVGWISYIQFIESHTVIVRLFPKEDTVLDRGK